jgi:alanine-glyoxylate transaminase/serine-glyoxylate transaminase/serine-pyruvate transaminase
VHAETSTGVQSDAKTLAELARKHGAYTIVDAVTSLGGTRRVDRRVGIDAVYSASQKCLSCTPGLSPVSFSDRVVEMVKKRSEKVHSWFMDMNLLLGYWGAANRTYHHTAPTNSLYALHEALLMLREEGWRTPGRAISATTPPCGPASRRSGFTTWSKSRIGCRR